MRQRLILFAPARVEALKEALDAGDVAAVVFQRPDAAGVAAAQQAGAAALIASERWADRVAADGLYVAGDAAAALRARPEGAICGVAAATRHAAMAAGEAGADYVAFEGAEAADLAKWWADLFEVPGVAAGPFADRDALIGSGAEFVAILDLFEMPSPAEAVASVNAALDARDAQP
ncbi:MAG: hypothetical protein AAF318_13265 [Pseudomonadota bacterium]